jgi:hypothetical protein
MNKRSHIRLFLIATLVWAGFWVGGLPAYYQQYSTTAMAVFDILVLVLITAIVYLVLRAVRTRSRLRVAGWLSFYFTVPLFIYDWLYCGIYLGHGMTFFARFWYLTVYYAIPWIVLPIVAWMLDRRSASSGPV